MSRNNSNKTDVLDPEVAAMAERRRFSAETKLRILEEAEACTDPGEIGALLRREGIYSSYLHRWRQARDRGQLNGLKAKKRGAKPAADKETLEELEKLKRENKRLRRRLTQAEAIIEAQKKLSLILGVDLEESESSEKR